ncbi:hypothetical protein [Streptomyces sp. NPDC003036]|uniref:hypothetical protein n=1 Tax=Streptomyces sp. NPDC003036 TaxID=3154442 RepID=UPI0033A8792C
MKTCDRFERMKNAYETDLAVLNGHADRHAGTNPAKASSRIAKGVQLNMARALSKHYDRCRVCC